MVNISLKDTFDLLTSSVPHLKTSELIEKCNEAHTVSKKDSIGSMRLIAPPRK